MNNQKLIDELIYELENVSSKSINKDFEDGYNGGIRHALELVKESARTGQYILTANKSHVRAIEQIAKKAGVTIPYPVTVDEIVRMDRYTCGSSIQRDGLLVDEAIMVLSKIIGLKITGVTISLEGEGQC